MRNSFNGKHDTQGQNSISVLAYFIEKLWYWDPPVVPDDIGSVNFLARALPCIPT